MTEYYVGLDVSLNKTAVCVADSEGKVLSEAMVPTEPEAIDEYLRRTGLAFRRVGLEASNLAIWLYHELRARGYELVVLETRHAKAAMAAQNMKTDRNDARGLAQIVRTGWFKAVHVKSDESQRIKMLVNNRRFLIGQRIALENQIRGTIKVFGLKTGKVQREKYDQRIRELISQDGELEAGILPLLEMRAALFAKTEMLERILVKAAKQDDVCRLFMTIPGVGPLTALLYKAVIDDPKRFRRPRDVAAHLGMTPRKFASGEIDYNSGITKCGDRLLRGHLYEAASYVLRPSTKRSALKAWGQKIQKRSCLKNARVAVARKLSVIMHRMWADGSSFDWGLTTDIELKAAA